MGPAPQHGHDCVPTHPPWYHCGSTASRFAGLRAVQPCAPPGTNCELIGTAVTMKPFGRSAAPTLLIACATLLSLLPSQSKSMPVHATPDDWMKACHPLSIALADSVERPTGGVAWQPSPPTDALTFTPDARSCYAILYTEEGLQQLFGTNENCPLVITISKNATITRLKPALEI